MENRIKLTLVGMTYNPMENGAYALLLAPEGDRRRIPVVIGAAEAQSIAVVAQRLNPGRPLTHDLMVSLSHAFGLRLKEVFIYKFEDGVFSAEMTYEDNERTVTIDARTSDAIAVALRMGAPVYTTPAIVEETAFTIALEDDGKEENHDNDSGDANTPDDPYQTMDLTQLDEALEQAVANDDFELAARIKAIIDSRKDS